MPESTESIEIAMSDVEVSPILGVSPSTLRVWRSKGKGPTYRKVGGKVIYLLSEVIEYRDRNIVESASDR